MYDSTTNAVTTTTTSPLHDSTSPTLRRHNSISSVTPNKFPLKPPKRTGSLDLELLLLKSSFTSYTSLRDMLPSPHVAVNSPTASSSAVNSCYEISIRNRLVKQAAWAYLQPMSSSVGNSSTPSFLRRLCHSFSSDNPLVAFFGSLVSGFTRIFQRMLHAFSGHVRI